VTVTLVKNATLGDCMPTAFAANLTLVAELNAQIAIELAAIASLNLRLGAALEVSLSPPAIMLDAAIVAQLAASVTLPSFSVNLSGIVADIQAELAVKAAALAELQAKLAAALALTVSFGSAGMRLYKYTGPLDQMGGELAAYTAGTPGDGGMQQDAEVTSVFFVTDIPGASVALSLILGV